MTIHPPALLAVAEAAASSDAIATLLLSAVFFVALIAVFGAIPIALSRRRKGADRLLLGSLLWTLAAAALALYLLFARYHWTRENTILTGSGYFDPADAPPAPHLPWPLAALLALTYLTLLTCSLAARKTPLLTPPPSAQPTPRTPLNTRLHNN